VWRSGKGVELSVGDRAFSPCCCHVECHFRQLVRAHLPLSPSSIQFGACEQAHHMTHWPHVHGFHAAGLRAIEFEFKPMCQIPWEGLLFTAHFFNSVTVWLGGIVVAALVTSI